MGSRNYCLSEVEKNVFDVIDGLEIVTNPLHSFNQLDFYGGRSIEMRRWRVGWWCWVGDELANPLDFFNDLVDFPANRT